MATISTLGIGSGIDLEGLLEKLTKAENIRLNPVSSQQASAKAKISAFGVLKSALATFNTATEKLKDSALFGNTKVTSSSDKYFSVTTANGAAAGNYSVEVTNVATAHSLASGTQADSDTTLLGNGAATRTLTIEQANGKKIDVTLDNDQTSLKGIADAINKENGEVNASVVRSGDSSYQLVLTSKETGLTNAISKVSSDDAALNTELGYDSASTGATKMQETIKAQDANLSVNGISITSSTNTIENIVSGVSITLKEPTAAAQSFSVQQNTDETLKQVKEWADAFNTLQSTMSRLTQFTQTTGGEAASTSNGDLVGDGTLRNINQRIKSVISTGQSGGGDFAILAEIGVTLDKDGKLSVDETKLKAAIEKNPDDIGKLFIGDGKETGLATQMSSALTNFTKTDGAIDAATTGLNTTLKVLEKRYTEIGNSIDANIERYRKQFTQLDVTMNKLNQTSSYLTQQFASLTQSS